ncbi:aromatic acid exporter family protein [Shouchella tritolerans]|uniref:aromatic acid exporter family protein n=1 Tax=Shouchella tritolerans TaxID=2979466 RepID=UPI002981E2FA|nr:aromatic acid exporter family protein [Shouchella tritolerans]
MRYMRLGARILKTGLAVVLALYLANWLQFNPPTFAAIAAAFAIQPSLFRTLRTFSHQVQANLIGAIIGVLFVMTFGHAPFVVGVVVMLSIAIFIKLKLEPAIIPTAIVTVIIIMESPSDNFLEFAAQRFILVLIGILAAFLVNLAFIPPRYENKVYDKLSSTTDSLLEWLELVARREADTIALREDMKAQKVHLDKTNDLFNLFREERNYFRSKTFNQRRKVVVFRQMISTSEKAYRVLEMLEHRSEDFSNLPDRVKGRIEEQITSLTDYHRRIVLRYNGKVSINAPEDYVSEIEEGQSTMTNLFVTLYEEEAFDLAQWHSFLPAISAIIEYQQELEHLDTLVENHQIHTTEDDGTT